MCVGIALALVFLMLFYAGAVLSELALSEQVGEQFVMIGQGWEMLTVLWPLLTLGMMLGILLTLVFFKWKKII